VLSDRDRLSLREEYDHLTRMVEDLDAARERASVIHESLASRLAEMTNQRMYILSIVAASFLPLALVTGLLGVNVGGMPGAENPYGFREVNLLLLAVGGAIWAVFRWRGWF
jgi:zinc transporter